MKLKALAAAAALVGMAATPANALLVGGDTTVDASQIIGGGVASKSLVTETTLKHGVFTAEAELIRGVDENGSIAFDLTANSSVITVESNTVNTAGDINNLLIKILVDGVEVASQSNVFGSAVFPAITVIAGEVLRIEATWDTFNASVANLDFKIDATPLPAGVALFLTGLAGLGVARKRKSA